MKQLGSLLLFLIILFSPKSFSAEDSTYNFNWLDPDKEVYVLQNRKFRKVGKVYVNLGGGITTSGAFADAFVGQLRAGFFFREDWGIELLYSSNSPDTNETYESVLAQQSVPFVRLVQNYLGAMVMWSPFYAKINTFDQIFYFDWMFGLGYASLTEENNRTALNAGAGGFQRVNELTSETHGGVIWTTAFRFYLNQTWSIRTDLTAVHYQAEKALANDNAKVWYQNFDFTVGVGLTF